MYFATSATSAAAGCCRSAEDAAEARSVPAFCVPVATYTAGTRRVFAHKSESHSPEKVSRVGGCQGTGERRVRGPRSARRGAVWGVLNCSICWDTEVGSPLPTGLSRPPPTCTLGAQRTRRAIPIGSRSGHVQTDPFDFQSEIRGGKSARNEQERVWFTPRRVVLCVSHANAGVGLWDSSERGAGLRFSGSGPKVFFGQKRVRHAWGRRVSPGTSGHEQTERAAPPLVVGRRVTGTDVSINRQSCSGSHSLARGKESSRIDTFSVSGRTCVCVKYSSFCFPGQFFNHFSVASVELFRAGRARKRLRENWIVPHVH